jgi:hypothetical protein
MLRKKRLHLVFLLFFAGVVNYLDRCCPRRHRLPAA